MRLRTIVLGIALLSVTAIWAQDSASQAPAAGTAPIVTDPQSAAPVNRAPIALRSRRMMPAQRRAQSADPAFEARVEELQETVAQMHALLNQMQSKAGSAKDKAATADNVRMWEILLGHLDRTLAEARAAAMQRTLMYQRAMPGQSPGGPPSSPAAVPGGAAAAPAPPPQ